MYNIGRDTYSCDTCWFEMKWDGHDDAHGDMWGCESCNTIFCTKCFVDALGRPAFDKMTHESDLVLCPTCFQKVCATGGDLNG